MGAGEIGKVNPLLFSDIAGESVVGPSVFLFTSGIVGEDWGSEVVGLLSGAGALGLPSGAEALDLASGAGALGLLSGTRGVSSFSLPSINEVGTAPLEYPSSSRSR